MAAKYLQFYIQQQHIKILIMELLFENTLLKERMPTDKIREQLEKIDVFLEPQEEDCGQLHPLLLRLHDVYYENWSTADKESDHESCVEIMDEIITKVNNNIEIKI